jgi:hypothetical protein
VVLASPLSKTAMTCGLWTMDESCGMQLTEWVHHALTLHFLSR